jgi:hypothetical protein
MLFSIGSHKIMRTVPSGFFVRQFCLSWNWKCALLSATARSLVYLTAMAPHGALGRQAVVLVEIAYVTITAGLYAGMQQRALGLRSRLLGNAIVVLGVPGLAQALDWLAHRAVDATPPARATLAVSLFAAVSALFHLHIMRNGVLLTGRGRSLFDDFRRMPRLLAGFVQRPVALFAAIAPRPAAQVESKAA